MKIQKPAEGILQTHEWGSSKMYKVVCQCGNDDDAIELDVEADDLGVTVTHYTTQKTNWWTGNGLITRLRLTWQLWRHGYVKYQSSTMMSEQQALNYAETLKSAVADVKQLRQQRLDKKS